jgi:ubiquinone/menaquinone biosynthesis C-methylase UbiE
MNTGQWQIDGSAAELYERYVVRYILGPWSAPLVDAAHVAPGDRVLDVACGTGAVARIAAQRAGARGAVTALDLNAEMLAVGRSLPAGNGAPVDWVQRSALDLGLQDRSFDVVLCQQGLQFFPDRALALREMHRVLRTGGRLALSVWKNAGTYNSAVGRALAEFIGPEIAARFCASRAVPSVDETQVLVSSAGFRQIQISVARMQIRLPPLEDFVPCHLASTPVSSAIASADAGVRKKMAADVAMQLEDCADADGVTYPEETVLVIARS